MKIGIITSYFEDEYKTITYHELAKRYIRKGHEVHVINGVFTRNLPQHEVVDGIYIHRVKIPKLRLRSLLVTIYGKKILQEVDDCVDVFDVHDLHGWLLKKIIKKPYIVQVPSTYSEAWEKLKMSSSFHFNSAYILSFVGSLILPKVQKSISVNSDKVIAICDNTKDWLIKDYGITEEKITVIHAGIDINCFNPSNDGKRWRKKLNIDDKKVVLCMAKLVYLKGFHYLIEAFKKIADEYKDTMLVIAGSGDKSEERRLHDLVVSLGIKDKVIFAGWINYNDVPYLHAAADIFVHPSLLEGTPLVILEAMATGKPVIATDIAGVPEMITDGVDGFLVEEKNVEQIVEKLSVLLEDEVLCKETGQNARKKVEEKFNWDMIAERILDVYEEVIQDQNNQRTK